MMKSNMEEAKIRRGLEALSKFLGISKLFEKSYYDSVWSVHGFTVGGKAYILSGGWDMELHAYDGHGNIVFEKSCSDVVESVNGFTVGGKVYILSGGYDNKLHVYDEQGNELFEKSYSDWVRSVHGFTANGKAYILAGGKDKKLHVYDEWGNKLFEKSYFGPVESVQGFTANGKAYILAGGKDKKLHVYDEWGNKLFEKSYSDTVWSVHGFTANGKAYILAGGKDKKLHVYSVVFMDTPTLLSLIEWSGKVGIDTNFEGIIEIALEEPEKGVRMAENLLEQLEEKKREYENLKTEWSEISRRYEKAGLEIGGMPTKFEELKNRLKELSSEGHRPSLSIDLSGEISENIWSKAEIIVENNGEINLENISIEFQSKVVESEGIKQIPVLKKGEERKIPIRIKSRDAGYVPVEILAKYTNPLTEQEEEKRIFPEIYVKEKGMKEGGEREEIL